MTHTRRRAYPAYRAATMPRLSEVPSHWSEKQLRFVADLRLSNVDKKSVEGQAAVRLCNYTDVYYNERISAGMPFMEATATQDQIRRFSLRRGDVLLTKDSETADDIGVPSVIADELPGVLCGYHLAVARPSAGICGPYLARALSVSPVRDQLFVAANGVTRFGLARADIGTAIVPVPPESEQRAIAAFLDRETARIDALIKKKRRLIELLQEKRATVRTHAVTSGIRDGVELTRPWIAAVGRIPRHWKLKRLKHVSPRLMVGVVVNPSTFVSETGKPFLVGSNIKEGEIRWREAAKIDAAGNRVNSKSILRKDDLVTVRVGAPGVTAVVPAEVAGGNAASVMIIRGHKTFDSRWLCHVMNSRIVRSQIEVVQYGAAQEQFNISHAVDFWIPVPPLEEQRAIADCVDDKFDKIERLVSHLIRTVELLSEQRAALIAAAVTGQIDVREAA